MPSLAPGYRLAETGGVKNHRLIFLATTVCIFLFLPGCSRSRPRIVPLPPAESTWLNDYKKAQQEAKASNKFLLLDFTGSDWCGWCKRLEQEILSQSQFENYARENLVLLEVDFPRAKPQSPELRIKNWRSNIRLKDFPRSSCSTATGKSFGSTTATSPTDWQHLSRSWRNCAKAERAFVFVATQKSAVISQL